MSSLSNNSDHGNADFEGKPLDAWPTPAIDAAAELIRHARKQSGKPLNFTTQLDHDVLDVLQARGVLAVTYEAGEFAPDVFISIPDRGQR